jgi:hypothetical protein
MKVTLTIHIFLLTLLLFPFTAISNDNWELVWSDEFDYEEGYVRNGEKQFYTANEQKNARGNQGSLVIEAHNIQNKSEVSFFEYIFGPKKNDKIYIGKFNHTAFKRMGIWSI